MRNLLALAALLLIAFLGLGWYMGWYRVQSTSSGDGRRQINIDLDTGKIKDDVRNQVRKWLDGPGDGTTPVTTPAPNPPSGPQTGTGGTTTPGTPTGFRRDPDGFTFPANPTPPSSSGPFLPPPR